ncbi:unnamed protein product, partial [Ectocarpus sp. 4 AP-2014]
GLPGASSDRGGAGCWMDVHVGTIWRMYIASQVYHRLLM